jgi:hypothetical protein
MYFPIRMYIIPIGAFFAGSFPDIVLIRNPKLFIMEAKTINPEKALKNLIMDLIEGCRAGDQKAQFVIYKLYKKTMYNLCLSIVNDKRCAEEIIQESFLSAFDRISTCPGSINFDEWLQKIVINSAFDSLDGKRNLLIA